MTSSPSTSDQQQQLSSLQARISEIQAERDGFARIATQTLAIVRAQPLAVRPQGVWIQEGDQDQMAALEGSRVQLSAGKAWRWAEITEDTSPVTMLPLFDHQLLPGQPRPDITPFRGSFPLEILEAIVDLCDAKTMALFAQSSLACLNIFGPKLLKTVAISSSKQASGLKSLFAPRDPILFPRLDHGLSLHHIQTLRVFASSLADFKLQPSHIHTSRFTSPQPVLHLQRLVIQMDFEAINYHIPPSTSSDSESASTDEDDNSESADEDDATLACFKPQTALLSLLNPVNLTIKGITKRRYFDQSYRITRAAATVISRWTRLRTVILVNVDLFVLDSHADHVDAFLDEDFESRQRFFLGLGGTEEALQELEESSRRGWRVRWLLCRSEGVTPFDSMWESLPHQLVARDETLRAGRVTSAILVVRNAAAKEEVEGQMSKWDNVRGCLRVEVQDYSE